jgi:hypothetical protein
MDTIIQVEVEPMPLCQIYRLTKAILPLLSLKKFKATVKLPDLVFIDISFYLVKMDSLNKAKPFVRMGRKPTGL